MKLTQSFVNQNIALSKPANTKKAEQLGLDTRIAPQLVSKVVDFTSDVNRYDKAASGKADQQYYSFLNRSGGGEYEAFNRAKEASKRSLAVVKQVQGNRLQFDIDSIEAKMIEMFKGCIDLAKLKSYAGDFMSFKYVFEASQGKLSNAYLDLDMDLSDVFLYAQKALEQLVKDSPDYPVLMTMILSSQLLSGSQFSELQDAPAKMMNKAAHSQKALACFKRLLNSGKIRLEDFAEKAVKLDPSSAIKSLVKLALGSSRKDQRLTIVKILSNVAKESAGTMGGSMASKGLKKIIKKEGSNGVLRAAFHGLKESAKAGNPESLKVLKELAEDPTISTNKAFKAIECLTDIAKSNSNAGSGATDILIHLATNKKLSPKIRMKSVDGLTDVVKSGNSNSKKASGALLKLADNPLDPVGNRALKNILSLQNTDKFDQDKLSKVMFNAANNKKIDLKTRLAAYNKLEKINDAQGEGASSAKKFIINLARVPSDQVGKRAFTKVAKMNSSEATKSQDTMFLMNQFKPDNKFNAGNQNSQNYKFMNNFNFVKA